MFCSIIFSEILYSIIIIVIISEFSESLRELGSCLLEKTALNDDEESGEFYLSKETVCA